jgi:hypothetical protein
MPVQVLMLDDRRFDCAACHRPRQGLSASPTYWYDMPTKAPQNGGTVYRPKIYDSTSIATVLLSYVSSSAWAVP